MKYTALYREWRPDTFEDIVGQDTIVQTLKNQIKRKRIAHAYLFSGPRGTGKTSTAKIFASAVNCTDPIDVSPCGKCRVCNQSVIGNTMDIIEIDAASNNGVDEIRDLRDKAKFPPAISRYKVYIIDEVHMLSTGAFNALLKTLEEPPSHVIFILATTEPHKLPATIISRCQRYDFKLIPLATIVKQLKRVATETGIEIEEEALYTIARWSEGGMRDALSLLDQCIGFCGDSILNNDVLAILGTADEDFMFAMVDSILAGDGVSALKSVNTLIEDGRDISVFVKDITTHMRNLLIIKTCNKNAAKLIDSSPDTLNTYMAQAERTGLMRIFRAVDIFVNLESELRWASQPRILLELAITRICRPEEEQDYDSLLDRLQSLEKKLNDIDTGKYMPPTDRAISHSGDSNHKAGDKNSSYQPSDEKKGKIDLPLEAEETDLTPEKKEAKQPSRGEDAATSDIDLSNIWPKILNIIKKERIAIYSLLLDAQFVHKGENVATLVFPPEQGFYVTAIEKEDNRSFIEDIIFKISGKEVRLQCTLQGEGTDTLEEDLVVKKAIEIFGEEHVEIVDE